MSIYLDFEEPIKSLEEQIEQTKEIGASTEVDMSDKIKELEEKVELVKRELALAEARISHLESKEK